MSAGDDDRLRRLVHSPGLLVRVGWGTLLLARPDTGLDALDAHGSSEPARVVIRILGARHLVEAGLELYQGPRWREAGGVVDAIHSATALGFATFDHDWRRAAIADAVVAAGFATVGLTRAGGTPP